MLAESRAAHEAPVGIDAKLHGRDLEQRIGRGDETAGLDVHDHRQEPAEPVAHRGDRSAHGEAGSRSFHSSGSPAPIGTTLSAPKGKLSGTVHARRSRTTVPVLRGKP